MHDLFITLTVYALSDSGSYIKVHKVGHRIIEDINHVDLILGFDKDHFINYLWKDESDNETRRNLESLLEAG